MRAQYTSYYVETSDELDIIEDSHGQEYQVVSVKLHHDYRDQVSVELDQCGVSYPKSKTEHYTTSEGWKCDMILDTDPILIEWLDKIKRAVLAVLRL